MERNTQPSLFSLGEKKKKEKAGVHTERTPTWRWIKNTMKSVSPEIFVPAAIRSNKVLLRCHRDLQCESLHGVIPDEGVSPQLTAAGEETHL